MIKFIKQLFSNRADEELSNNEKVIKYLEAENIKKELREFEKQRTSNYIRDVAKELEVGVLSNNTNWLYIQEVGEFISPIGNDKLHKVILTEKNHRGQNIKIAEIECTNQIYSEWISCLCNTMWHTHNKILQDIHGNKYPVGKMCGYKCSIRFMFQ